MNGLIRNILPTIVCVSLAMGGSTAVASKACKGMSQQACSASSDCTWVKGYVSKSGKQVDAYCRAKGAKKAPVEKKSETKSQKSKDVKTSNEAASKKQAKEKKETQPKK